MGFPTGYTEDLLPNFFLYILSLLGLLKTTISSLLGLIDPSFSTPTTSSWAEPRSKSMSRSASMICNLLPVAKFNDVVQTEGSFIESCAVCLHDFEGDDEIRRLRNCQHIFHRGCLDRWIAHEHKTCPLCRKSFVPDEMVEDFHESLWDSPDENNANAMFAEFSGSLSAIRHCL